MLLEQSQLNQDQRHMKEKQEKFTRQDKDLSRGLVFHHGRRRPHHLPSPDCDAATFDMEDY